MESGILYTYLMNTVNTILGENANKYFKAFFECEFRDKQHNAVYHKDKLCFITYVKSVLCLVFYSALANRVVPLIGSMQWKSDL